MKAPDHIQTPTQYLASLPAERRADVTALHKAIRQAAPSLKPHIAYGGLGYGTYPFKYASGRVVDMPLVGLASQKRHIGLYFCCAGADGYLPDNKRKGLGKVSVGKSCIRFKRLADLNLPGALRLVKIAAGLNKVRR